MIAITCDLNTDQLAHRIQMWIDHHTLFKPITKGTLRPEPARSPRRKGSDPPRHERAARPVHLDLPEDVALAPARVMHRR